MKSNNEPLIVEKQLEASIETVWNAITQIDQMKEWFFEQIENYEPSVGFETRFDVKSGERVFPHLWKITEVNPPNEITTNWKYEGYKGNSIVTFKLESENNKTNMKVITKIVEDFQDDIPEFSHESCVGGWNYFLERLNSYLQNNREKN